MINQPEPNGGAQPADQPIVVPAQSTPLGPPAPPARTVKPLPWIIGGITAVVMLCCGIGAVANLVGETDDSVVGSAGPSVTPSASPSAVVTSAAPTTTPPAPPVTSVPAPTSVAPTPKPKVYTGRGDDVIVLGGDADAARITHSKGQSNFVVYAYSLETGEGGLLVNEIGGYSGTRPLQAPALVQVTADGNWSISPR